MRRMFDQKQYDAKVLEIDNHLTVLDASKTNRSLISSRIKAFTAADFVAVAAGLLLTISSANCNPDQYDLATVDYTGLEVDDINEVRILCTVDGVSIITLNPDAVVDIAVERSLATNQFIEWDTDASLISLMTTDYRIDAFAGGGFTNTIGVSKAFSVQLISAEGSITSSNIGMLMHTVGCSMVISGDL